MFPVFRHLTWSGSLAVLDTETTGRDPRRDRVVQVAALRYTRDDAPVSFDRRVDPGVSIPEAAVRVHGIRDADVAGCPAFGEVAAELLAFLGDAHLAGYNVAFDLQFLAAEFGRCGLTLPLTGRAVLDAMKIFHRHEPRDLAAAVKFYCGRKHERAHSALDDAQATVELLDAQLEKYPDLPRHAADLGRYLAPVDLAGKFREEDGTVVFNFGKWLGRPLNEVADKDPVYLAWMLDRDFLPDVKEAVRRALERVGARHSTARR